MALAAGAGPALREAEGGLNTGGETGVGLAPAETVALWVKAVATMGPDELESLDDRGFAAVARGSLGDLRRAIAGTG